MTDYHLPSARAMIGGWTLDRYQRLLVPQIIVSPLLLIFVLLRWPNLVVAVAELAWFAWVGVRTGQRRGGRVEALAGGALSGFFSGLSVSLGRWLADGDVRWGANVIAETLITAGIGALLATALFVLTRRQPQ